MEGKTHVNLPWIHYFHHLSVVYLLKNTRIFSSMNLPISISLPLLMWKGIILFLQAMLIANFIYSNCITSISYGWINSDFFCLVSGTRFKTPVHIWNFTTRALESVFCSNWMPTELVIIQWFLPNMDAKSSHEL